MENATQALIIAGTMLIAILVLSVGVKLVSTTSVVGEAYHQTQEEKEIIKFNEKFTKFEGRENITIQEIVTLANFIKEYEEKNGISVDITPDYTNPGYTPEALALEISTKSNDENGDVIHYECKGIEYTNGRVSKIKFAEIIK